VHRLDYLWRRRLAIPDRSTANLNTSVFLPSVLSASRACPDRKLLTYASLAAYASTSAPTMIRYTANGANPRLRTQAMNQATAA
jgi:hypothetical protein